MTSRRYDLDAMQAFVTLLDQKITALTESSEGVKRTAEAILSQFTGEAADAYAASRTEWLRNAGELITDVRAVRDKIENARANYSEVEKTNREMRA